jgi:hypothetical protein
MAWVEERYIKTEGFPRQLLRHIRSACEAETIEWFPGSYVVSMNYSYGSFGWKGGIFQIIEINESVREIKLIGGELDHEDLTLMVLQG